MDRIERAINKVLAPTLKAAGFELKKEWNCFVKFTDYGFDSFMVIDQGRLDVDQISIGCSIGIRHNRIQELFNTFGFIYGEEEQKQNVTFSLSYPFNARKNLDDYLKLNALTLQEDIAIVAKHLEQAFAEHAIPFYNRFSKLSEVEELLNKKPLADISPYSGGFIPEDLMVTSLLCAKAVNPARYDLVREACVAMEGGMYPKEKRMEILKKVDAMVIE